MRTWSVENPESTTVTTLGPAKAEDIEVIIPTTIPGATNAPAVERLTEPTLAVRAI
jgi:hypothetical protein